MPFKGLGRRKPDAFEQAAAQLAAAASSGIVVAKNFPSLEEEELKCLGGIMFYTKAAFIIQCMRLLEKNSSDPRKWNSLLRAFEPFVFSSDPLEAMNLVEYVNHLIDLTIRLEQLNTNKTQTIDEYRHRAREWWEDWLVPISLDPQRFEQISFDIGIEVFRNIWQEMNILSRMVSSIGVALK